MTEKDNINEVIRNLYSLLKKGEQEINETLKDKNKCYDLVGLSEDAQKNKIDNMRRQLLVRFHPDKMKQHINEPPGPKYEEAKDAYNKIQHIVDSAFLKINDVNNEIDFEGEDSYFVLRKRLWKSIEQEIKYYTLLLDMGEFLTRDEKGGKKRMIELMNKSEAELIRIYKTKRQNFSAFQKEFTKLILEIKNERLKKTLKETHETLLGGISVLDSTQEKYTVFIKLVLETNNTKDPSFILERKNNSITITEKNSIIPPRNLFLASIAVAVSITAIIVDNAIPAASNVAHKIPTIAFSILLSLAVVTGICCILYVSRMANTPRPVIEDITFEPTTPFRGLASS